MSNEVTTDQLVSDLKAVISDAEALLEATSAQAGERIQDVRARTQQTLDRARARLEEIEKDALRAVREAADVAEDYVRENPWQSVGVAAGVGLLLGLLIGRR